jgi:uncharacterized membrane protein
VKGGEAVNEAPAANARRGPLEEANSPRAALSPQTVVIALATITLLAGFLSFYRIGGLSFWTDEFVTIRFADSALHEMALLVWPKQMNMSLYYLAANLWRRLFTSPSEAELRSLSAIFSIATVPAIFLLAKRLAAGATANGLGLTAALLFSLNAYRIQYAQELRSYSLTPLLGVVSTLFLISAVRNAKSRKLWLCYALTSAAGVYAHYFMLFLVFAHILSLFALYGENRGDFSLKPFAANYAAIAALIGPVIVAAYCTGTAGISWIKAPTRNDIDHLTVLLAGNGGYPLARAYVLALSVGCVALWRSRRLGKWTPALVTSCGFFPPCIALVISAEYAPVFFSRYFTFLIPFLSLIVAFGLVELAGAERLAFKVVGVALLAFIVVTSITGVANYFTMAQKEDWRSIAKFLSTQCSGLNDLRLYYPTWTQSFSSYYDMSVRTRDDDAERILDDSSQIDIAAAIPKYYDQVCLVLRLGGPFPNLSTIEAALRADFSNPTVHAFLGQMKVEVYERRFTP